MPTATNYAAHPAHFCSRAVRPIESGKRAPAYRGRPPGREYLSTSPSRATTASPHADDDAQSTATASAVHTCRIRESLSGPMRFVSRATETHSTVSRLITV